MINRKIITTPEEKYEIESLRKEVFHLEELSPFYIRQLLNKKEYALVARDDNNKMIAGCYFHRFETSLMIDQVFVKEEYQNKEYKLGRNLINNLLVNHAYIGKLLGNHVSICMIEANNEKAKALYKKMGFRESNIDPDTLIKPIV